MPQDNILWKSFREINGARPFCGNGKAESTHAGPQKIAGFAVGIPEVSLGAVPSNPSGFYASVTNLSEVH